MRHYYIFVFIFWFSLSSAQSLPLYNADNGVEYPSLKRFCEGEKFSVKVNAAASSTGDYEIELINNFTIAKPATAVPFTNKIGNSHFSNVLSIPFVFNYFGREYHSLVVGSNGRLLFGSAAELAELGDSNFSDKVHSGNNSESTTVKLPALIYNKIDPDDPERVLDLAQIFAGFTDLGYYNTNSYEKITYGTTVYQGTQGFGISIDQVPERTAGTGYDKLITSQILLLQDHRIIIKVNKSSVQTNAIIGLQNSGASKARWPENSEPGSVYNNGAWKNSYEAWLFKPSQQLTPQFKWYRNNVLIPGANSPTVTDFAPNDGDALKVEVSYLEEPGNIKTGQIIFNKIAKPVITASSTGGCVAAVTLTVPNNPDLKFEWFRVGSTDLLGAGTSYQASVTGDYYVRASRIGAPICFEESVPVNVNLNSTLPVFNENNTALYYCENTGAANKTVNLFDYYPADPTKYRLTFTENGTTIQDPANLVIDANTSRTLHIDVEDINAGTGCRISRDFIIRYDSLPVAKNELPRTFCFGQTFVDVSQYLLDIAGPNYTLFDYQYSADGVSYATNSVIHAAAFPKVLVKILPKNAPARSCITVSTIVFTENSKVAANRPTTQLPPQCASSFLPFDLNSLKPEINPGNVKITFHNSLIGAKNNNDLFLNDNSVGSKTVYIRVVDILTNCASPDHPSISLLVYPKPTLLVNNLQKKNCQGDSVFNLRHNLSDLVNVPPSITAQLEYYNPGGTLLTGAQIMQYNEAVFGPNPYVKIIYNTTCSDIVTFSLSYDPKPVANTPTILVCSEPTYTLERFKNKVISNPAAYTFTDENGNPLPAVFDVSSLPEPIRFLIKNDATGCISELQTVTFIQNENSPLNATESSFELCDTDFDGKTEFDLNLKKEDFTNASATFEYFKDAGFTQSIPAKYTNEQPFEQTVYVRITIPGYCPSSAQIHLVANTPTRSSELLDQYSICFGETLSIDAGSENDSIVWSDGQTGRYANFSAPGAYSVTLKNGGNGCAYTHDFVISDENQPKINLINQTSHSIEVIASGGTKPYTYYFNGQPQPNNVLTNPTELSYEIQVQSADGCFGPPQMIYFVKINNAFTPNGDGINDTWKIEQLDKMQQVSVVVIDRHGTKVFESTDPKFVEWDGQTGGKPAPTGTYWYFVSWYDTVTQKSEQRQGWVLLKNRR